MLPHGVVQLGSFLPVSLSQLFCNFEETYDLVSYDIMMENGNMVTSHRISPYYLWKVNLSHMVFMNHMIHGINVSILEN